MTMKRFTDKIALLLFILALLAGALLYGYVAHKRHYFPDEILRKAVDTLIFIKRDLINKPHHVFPIRYKKSGAVIYDQSKMSPGVTLVTGFWQDHDWTPGVKLLDAEGKTLHYWPVDPPRVWPKNPYYDVAAGSKEFKGNYVHGSYLYPNGDLVINIEYLGMFKLDTCGSIKWRLPYRTHHSITPDDDGNLWASGMKWVEPGDKRAETFPGLVAPFVESTAIKVSPDGKLLKEISLLEALYKQDYKYLFWKYGMIEEDIAHLNDVEPLSAKMADQYPGFAPGDLAVSFRLLDAVFVMDQDGNIKWYDSQTTIHQHDPDFEGNGWLTVFDNRDDYSNKGLTLGGSRIVALNLVTHESRVLYPTGNSQSFYTKAGGKHQLLPNGNRLITESRAGRIFEVTAAGELVWEWINKPYDNESVSEILEGTRYNISLDTINQWNCSE